MDVTIRDETPNDEAAIREVNDQAFGQLLEGRLVDLLREHNGVMISLVAVVDDRIVGHILFTPVALSSSTGEVDGAGLGPMAVLPEFQRSGIGSRLILTGIDRMRQREIRFVVVLGHPEYYPRFGFERASVYGVRCEWEVPDDAFMVLAITDQPTPGLARYRPEFMTAT